MRLGRAISRKWQLKPRYVNSEIADLIHKEDLTVHLYFKDFKRVVGKLDQTKPQQIEATQMYVHVT